VHDWDTTIEHSGKQSRGLYSANVRMCAGMCATTSYIVHLKGGEQTLLEYRSVGYIYLRAINVCWFHDTSTLKSPTFVVISTIIPTGPGAKVVRSKKPRDC
jgi:hypothetical protein